MMYYYILLYFGCELLSVPGNYTFLSEKTVLCFCTVKKLLNQSKNTPISMERKVLDKLASLFSFY